MNSEIEQSLRRLQQYMQQAAYSGYDPYDGLSSPLFRLPILKSNKKIRFLAQQFIKRFPINLRPLLGIKKGCNPVTLGLSIQAYSGMITAFPRLSADTAAEKELWEKEIEFLLDELEKLAAPGFSGTCWGYNFDWEARYASIPAYKPTIVATGIITNALYEYWKISKNKRCENMILSAAEFVLHDLKRTYDGETFCFSYSPFDSQIVLNASMKAVRLLAQCHEISGALPDLPDGQAGGRQKKRYLETAQPALQFVLNQQQKDGSFVYSNKRAAIDNYHTGYILDCLDAFQKCTGDLSFQSAIDKGLHFYLENFFTPDGLPKFYNNSLYPIDCTAAGQSLLTLIRFGQHELAEKVALYMIRNMQHRKGYFFFRKYRYSIVKTPFMRWSDAWMFVGLCTSPPPNPLQRGN